VAIKAGDGSFMQSAGRVTQVQSWSLPFFDNSYPEQSFRDAPGEFFFVVGFFGCLEG